MIRDRSIYKTYFHKEKQPHTMRLLENQLAKSFMIISIQNIFDRKGRLTN
jgi:hypothetical protein